MLEQLLEILVLRDQAVGRVERLDFIVGTQLDPLDPHGLVQHAVEVLAVLLQEVVGPEDLGPLDVFREVQVVLEVLADGHGQEVHVAHDVP